MTKRKKVSRPVSLLSFIQTVRAGQQTGWTVWILVGSLALVSLLSGVNWGSEKHIFVAGQIADADVRAERDLMVEDTIATRQKKKRAEEDQPLVYDLSMDAYRLFQSRLVDIIKAINTGGTIATDPALEKFAAENNDVIAQEVIRELSQREVQEYIFKKLLPQIREQLANGLVWDFRVARGGSGGVLIRNLDNNTSMLRTDAEAIPDAQSFLGELSVRMRSAPELNESSRKAIYTLLSTILPASLSLNREATQKNIEEATKSVQPVYYQLQRGEMIIRKGDKVTREQQLKMQSLFNSYADPVRWRQVGGAFAFGLILSLGFFMSPSGRPGTSLRPKDLVLISVILVFFCLAAKAMMIFGQRMDSLRMINALEIAFPAAGAAGLVSMVFSARRYGTMGLILAFYCALMFEASIPLMLYYFLGGMLATWLVTRAQNRQDVVWSVIPLTCGLFLIWIGFFVMSDNITPLEIPMQLIAILISSFLSLIILFAISPVLEMAFGYSTRFRLMELMSLEHPLMQEIMVTIPGTYHHSLVVANMVEAGAKAIGANSLLCKVAALYHDAGKLLYPESLIENQFGAPNKPDRLTPSMTALILLSHEKKGKE
nr:HDIG domain-containing protein [Desulfovibrio sp.]